MYLKLKLDSSNISNGRVYSVYDRLREMDIFSEAELILSSSEKRFTLKAKNLPLLEKILSF